MGNHMSCLMVGNNKKTIELVRSDGTLQILHNPLNAAQIMQEFPEYLVCQADSFYIGQKTPTLSPNEQLKVGNKYFLLPKYFFQSPLSLHSLASLISPPPPSKSPPNNSTAHLSAPFRSIERVSALCPPFVIEKGKAGRGLRIRVSTEFITKLMEDGRLNADKRGHPVGGEPNLQSGLCNNPKLQKDYAQLVKPQGQRWTPQLETIREREC